MSDRPHFLSREGIEALNGDGSREWIAQYMCEPPPPKPPGVYCATCDHSEPMYLDRMVPNHRGQEMPCCDRKSCRCIAHMVTWFRVDPTPDFCPSCNESIGISVAWCFACAAWFRALKEGYCTVDPPYPPCAAENADLH